MWMVEESLPTLNCERCDLNTIHHFEQRLAVNHQLDGLAFKANEFPIPVAIRHASIDHRGKEDELVWCEVEG